MFIKVWQMYLSRFNIWSSIDSSTAVSIENYKFQIFRSIFHAYPNYVFRFYFLRTLGIFKDYFKGRQEVVALVVICIWWLETIYPSSSFSWRSCCICTPKVLWPTSFLIFIVWMNWRTLQPTSFSSWCVSHVLRSLHHLVSHILGAVYWKERLSLYYKSNCVLG